MIKVKTDGVKTNVYIDGVEVTGVRAITFCHEECGKVPVLKIHLNASDLELDAEMIPELPDAFKAFYEKRSLL
ncbi:MAG: hypothetical protein PHX08_01920 [Lachnospiraceae bacterium]|nr:hypothetical protein [Lachnospiraceae bacterium]